MEIFHHLQRQIFFFNLLSVDGKQNKEDVCSLWSHLVMLQLMSQIDIIWASSTTS